MKELRTEITIDAGIEQVWNKLISFDQYDDWNPFITSIKGEAKLGSSLEVTMLNKDKTMTFTPEVTKFIDGKEFEWLGSAFMGGFKGRHYFVLERISDDQTLLIHGEFFSGWMSALVMKMIGEDTKKGFIAMNEAIAADLKKN